MERQDTITLVIKEVMEHEKLPIYLLNRIRDININLKLEDGSLEQTRLINALKDKLRSINPTISYQLINKFIYLLIGNKKVGSSIDSVLIFDGDIFIKYIDIKGNFAYMDFIPYTKGTSTYMKTTDEAFEMKTFAEANKGQEKGSDMAKFQYAFTNCVANSLRNNESNIFVGSSINGEITFHGPSKEALFFDQSIIDIKKKYDAKAPNEEAFKMLLINDEGKLIQTIVKLANLTKDRIEFFRQSENSWYGDDLGQYFLEKSIFGRRPSCFENAISHIDEGNCSFRERQLNQFRGTKCSVNTDNLVHLYDGERYNGKSIFREYHDISFEEERVRFIAIEKILQQALDVVDPSKRYTYEEALEYVDMLLADLIEKGIQLKKQ